MQVEMFEKPQRQDIFEIENARNLTRDQLVDTFVPTKAFYRLLSAKNHVVLGSRGSGKTALVKMLSHDHLARCDDDVAKRAIDSKAFIGIYVPTRLEWVGALKNKPWLTEAETEEHFLWRLNLATCISLINTIQSCLETYIPHRGSRALLEASISLELSKAWRLADASTVALESVRDQLAELEYDKHEQNARLRYVGFLEKGERAVGTQFHTDLFVPVKRGIEIASKHLEFTTETTWIICLDEAEFLSTLHQRIVNSQLRTAAGNIAFKVTTMPYCHYTLATNTNSSLDVGHDFEYVYIDQDPIVKQGLSVDDGAGFAALLFSKRAALAHSRLRSISLVGLLGNSTLLDRKSEEWGPESENYSLLLQHAGQETIDRATSLIEQPDKFRNEIARKVHGALLLREACKNVTGRRELDVYSGATMVVRCGDYNPRRMIRIFNSLLLERSKKDIQTMGKKYRLSKLEQNRILTAFSTSTLTRIQSEQEYGPQLYGLIDAIGRYMTKALHEEPLRTDQINSIIVDEGSGILNWRLIQRAVGLGLLFPNISANNPDQMPIGQGRFRLGYVLAPHFHLLPRRGKARRLSTIIEVMGYDATNYDLGGQRSFDFPTEGY